VAPELALPPTRLPDVPRQLSRVEPEAGWLDELLAGPALAAAPAVEAVVEAVAVEVPEAVAPVSRFAEPSLDDDLLPRRRTRR
jgi:hypothetical protein